MVEEDDGMEAFDFDERDLEFALNPGGRRHFQTKNQATYGGVRPPLLCSSATVVKIFSTFFLKIDIVLIFPSFLPLRSIWADKEESDEEDAYARPSFGKKAKKDYTAPINFVSGGIKQGNTVKKTGKEEKVKIEEIDDAPIEINFKRERRKQPKAGGNVFAGTRKLKYP
ncbi:unnamed protein product [Strongylus vulgaris]|uniref:Tuftelin interacting protein N-terminal domain-containing protein n=1 Tax=Strongylus vulgaris TaxID=40348 RepID=A0A3P7JBP6_STRVU|nr:unnamed protein product [Strongylus vulgaris]